MDHVTAGESFAPKYYEDRCEHAACTPDPESQRPQLMLHPCSSVSSSVRHKEEN